MKRLGLIVSAAVICVVASSQAQASVKVIKWSGSNFCQVWDNVVQPWPGSRYRVMSKNYKTWDRAWAKRNRLVAKGRCV